MAPHSHRDLSQCSGHHVLCCPGDWSEALLDCPDKWAGLVVDCLGRFGEPGRPGHGRCRSEPFSATAAADRRNLGLLNNLQAGLPVHGNASVLVSSSVRFEPSALGPGQTSFRLVVDGTDAHTVAAGIYQGVAWACVDPHNPGSNSSDEHIAVSIVIP